MPHLFNHFCHWGYICQPVRLTPQPYLLLVYPLYAPAYKSPLYALVLLIRLESLLFFYLRRWFLFYVVGVPIFSGSSFFLHLLVSSYLPLALCLTLSCLFRVLLPFLIGSVQRHAATLYPLRCGRLYSVSPSEKSEFLRAPRALAAHIPVLRVLVWWVPFSFFFLCLTSAILMVRYIWFFASFYFPAPDRMFPLLPVALGFNVHHVHYSVFGFAVSIISPVPLSSLNSPCLNINRAFSLRSLSGCLDGFLEKRTLDAPCPCRVCTWPSAQPVLFLPSPIGIPQCYYSRPSLFIIIG